MELVTILATVLGSLVLLGGLAVTKGADSRDGIGDDWTRPTSA
jgi:hypothetical protein